MEPEMTLEIKSPPARYKIENDIDLLRVSITPFNNYRLFKAIVYVFLLLLLITFLLTALPIIFIIILFTQFGFLDSLLSILLPTIASLALPSAVLALVIFTLYKNKIVVEINNQGIIIKNQYGPITGEWKYSSEEINNLRLSRPNKWVTSVDEGLSHLSTWGAILFDYRSKTIKICPSLSEEDAEQILSAIGEKFPIYKPEIKTGPCIRVGGKKTRIQALGLALLLFCVVGGVGTVAAYDPAVHEFPILGLITVWTLTIAIGVSTYINVLKPHWFAKLILLFSLATLFMAYSLKIIIPVTSGWAWAILCIGAYLFAWMLPIINPQIAKVINDKQVALGKNTAVRVLFYSGIFLSWLIPHDSDLSRLARMIWGILFAILAIGSGQLFAFQVWNQKIKEDQGSNPMD